MSYRWISWCSHISKIRQIHANLIRDQKHQCIIGWHISLSLAEARMFIGSKNSEVNKVKEGKEGAWDLLRSHEGKAKSVVARFVLAELELELQPSWMASFIHKKHREKQQMAEFSAKDAEDNGREQERWLKKKGSDWKKRTRRHEPKLHLSPSAQSDSQMRLSECVCERGERGQTSLRGSNARTSAWESEREGGRECRGKRECRKICWGGWGKEGGEGAWEDVCCQAQQKCWW